MIARHRLSWDMAPDWATVLLKNVRGTHYVFAESLVNGAKAWPSCLDKGNFKLNKKMWVLLETRPVNGLGEKDVKKPEDSGGSCDYYKVNIENPTSEDNWDKCTESAEYVAECNDIIEALDMTYAEANMFKEIWRSAAARTLGKLKAGHNEVRGAEKIEFFAKRNAIQKGVKQ